MSGDKLYVFAATLLGVAAVAIAAWLVVAAAVSDPLTADRPVEPPAGAIPATGTVGGD